MNLAIVETLLTDLQKAGGRLKLKADGSLSVTFQKPLPQELLDRLRVHKPDLIRAATWGWIPPEEIADTKAARRLAGRMGQIGGEALLDLIDDGTVPPEVRLAARRELRHRGARLAQEARP